MSPPGNVAADPLERARTGSQRHGGHAGVSGEAARECPRWSRQVMGDPLEQAGAGLVVSGKAARECPRWSRQATSPPGNTAADPLEAAPRSGESARECPRWSGQGCS